MANSTENIAINITYYRCTQGLTQEALSEMSNISCDYLSEIERKKKTPSIKCLDKISFNLQLETYKLLKNPSQKKIKFYKSNKILRKNHQV